MFRLLTILLICFIEIEQINSLNCYYCSGSSGCSDTFNSLAFGVSTTGSISTNIYCYKRRYVDTYERGGVSSCTDYWYSSNAYQRCCSTDYCNQFYKHFINPFIFIVYLLFKSMINL